MWGNSSGKAFSNYELKSQAIKENTDKFTTRRFKIFVLQKSTRSNSKLFKNICNSYNKRLSP